MLSDVAMPEPLSLWSRGEVHATGLNGELEGGQTSLVVVKKVMPQTEVDEAFQMKRQKAYNICLKKYLRCVKGVDDNIGRLFSYLKEEGLLDITLIMYTGDQGFFWVSMIYKINIGLMSRLFGYL